VLSVESRLIKSYGLRVASYGLRGKRQNTLEDTRYALRVNPLRLTTCDLRKEKTEG